jgi:hypothetical protein
MAPEVVLNRQYNQTVDTYSFGILVWQVATGKVPFQHFGKRAFLDRVVIGGERLKLYRNKWPAEFCDLLERCWAQDAGSRPDLAVVVKDLSRIAAQFEANEIEKGNFISTKVKRAMQRIASRHCFALSLFLLLLLSLGIILATIGTVTDEQSEQTYNTSADSTKVSCRVFGTFIVVTTAGMLYSLLMTNLGMWPYIDESFAFPRDSVLLRALKRRNSSRGRGSGLGHSNSDGDLYGNSSSTTTTNILSSINSNSLLSSSRNNNNNSSSSSSSSSSNNKNNSSSPIPHRSSPSPKNNTSNHTSIHKNYRRTRANSAEMGDLEEGAGYSDSQEDGTTTLSFNPLSKLNVSEVASSGRQQQ